MSNNMLSNEERYYIIKRIPEKLLNSLNYELTDLIDKITIVPKSLSIGRVYKIVLDGSLEQDGYEKALLFIPTGCGIKSHIHTDESEIYQLIRGTLIINGESMKTNICNVGQSHQIDPVFEDTIIMSYKESIQKDKDSSKSYIKTRHNIPKQT